MRTYPVVIDLETKHTFREFSEPKQLGVTVLALYDFATNAQHIFTEDNLNSVFPFLENASYVIGYNIVSFDLPVLQAYYPGNVEDFTAFDMLDDIRSKIGRRIGLNDVVFATLGEKKTGHGLMAIDYYKEGKWDELKKYCMDDVMVTKRLFEYGVENKEIYYMNELGKVSIPVAWRKYQDTEQTKQAPMTLPF